MTYHTSKSAEDWTKSLKADQFHAFVELALSPIVGMPGGELCGLTFAVKDIFDIAGSRTGCGNPDWLRTHAPALRTASTVEQLIAAGATLVAKTHTDELAFSLNGDNAHYGAPRNPAAPGRLSGGSSSGSAVSVAGSMVDFAIGTDTAGSVRIPASYCGVYGFRPSHGRIPLDGCMPLAPSFDTVGWFARDPDLLALIGRILLGQSWVRTEPPMRLLVPQEALDQLTPAARAAVVRAVETISQGLGIPATTHRLSEDGIDLEQLVGLFRRIQGREVWRAHGAWIRAVNPTLGPGVRERFQAAAAVAETDGSADDAARQGVRQVMQGFLGGGGLMLLPTAPGASPMVNTPLLELDVWRGRVIALTCLASLAGVPQVTMPLAEEAGCPLGVSILGAAGADELVLAAAMSV